MPCVCLWLAVFRLLLLLCCSFQEAFQPKVTEFQHEIKYLLAFRCFHIGLDRVLSLELELQSRCSISSSLRFTEGKNPTFCIQKSPTQLLNWCSTLLMPSQAAESLNSHANTTEQPLRKYTLVRIPVNFANTGSKCVFSFRPSHEFICNVIFFYEDVRNLHTLIFDPAPDKTCGRWGFINSFTWC